MAALLENLVCEEIAVDGLIHWLSSCSDEVIVVPLYVYFSYCLP